MNYLKKIYQLMSEGVLIHDPYRIDIPGVIFSLARRKHASIKNWKGAKVK